MVSEFSKFVRVGNVWFLGFTYHHDIRYCLTASEWKCRDATKHAGLAMPDFKMPNFSIFLSNCLIIL